MNECQLLPLFAGAMAGIHPNRRHNMNTNYTGNGYASRRDYLKDLSEERNWPLDAVFMLANVLGPSEDFDGLVTMLEDEFDY